MLKFLKNIIVLISLICKIICSLVALCVITAIALCGIGAGLYVIVALCPVIVFAFKQAIISMSVMQRIIFGIITVIIIFASLDIEDKEANEKIETIVENE